MPYVTCTRKKSHARVSIEVCVQCRVKNCPDYKDYCQPKLFASFVSGKADRSPLKNRKHKPEPLANGPVQMSFFQIN